MEDEKKKCFIIRPFSDVYDKRDEDIFSPAIKSIGIFPYCVSGDHGKINIIDDIEKGIRNSCICFADITTDNPNVWYEVGFAFACEKKVILVCSNERTGDFPFDVRHRDIIPYKTDSLRDFNALRDKIENKGKSYLMIEDDKNEEKNNFSIKYDKNNSSKESSITQVQNITYSLYCVRYLLKIQKGLKFQLSEITLFSPRNFDGQEWDFLDVDKFKTGIEYLSTSSENKEFISSKINELSSILTDIHSLYEEVCKFPMYTIEPISMYGYIEPVKDEDFPAKIILIREGVENCRFDSSRLWFNDSGEILNHMYWLKMDMHDIYYSEAISKEKTELFKQKKAQVYYNNILKYKCDKIGEIIDKYGKKMIE
jgi:hypothetical protein